MVMRIHFRNKAVVTIVVDRIDVSPREPSKKKPYLNAPGLEANHHTEG